MSIGESVILEASIYHVLVKAGFPDCIVVLVSKLGWGTGPMMLSDCHEPVAFVVLVRFVLYSMEVRKPGDGLHRPYTVDGSSVAGYLTAGLPVGDGSANNLVAVLMPAIAGRLAEVAWLGASSCLDAAAEATTMMLVPRVPTAAGRLPTWHLASLDLAYHQ